MSISVFCQKYVFSPQTSNSMLASDGEPPATSTSSFAGLGFVLCGFASRKIVLSAVTTSSSGHAVLLGRRWNALD
jgi:hypothetical protein